MIKFTLVTPIVMLSVFFGYFGSYFQMKHVYVILAVTAVSVTIAGYLLFHKQQKGGDK